MFWQTYIYVCHIMQAWPIWAYILPIAQFRSSWFIWTYLSYIHTILVPLKPKMSNYIILMYLIPEFLWLTWCHWYQYWHHMVPIALKMTSSPSLGQDNWNEVNLVMSCYWHLCQCHMMLMASSVAPLHSLCQSIQMRCSTTFWAMFSSRHWQKQHVMLMVLSMAPLHFCGR